MTRNRIFLLSAFLFLGISFAHCEQTEEEVRRDIILYGLEPEVSELVSKLIEEKNDSYSAELAGLFSKTRSPAIRDSILGLFASQKNAALKEYSLGVLDDPYDTKNSTVLAVFDYVSKVGLKEALPAIRNILKSDNPEYRDKAIDTLGKLGESDDAEYLVGYLDSEISGDEKERLVIRQSVMAALGTMKALETWDKLAAIVKDTEENSNIRATAAVAIGKMGKVEAIPILSKLFEDTDPALRTAAISGLSNFTTPEATEIMIAGFTDSYYKVRLESVSAAETRTIPDAMPYLLYRAKNDPVENVKLRAYEALAAYDTEQANAWLKGVFIDEKAADKYRLKAASVLLKKNPGYVFSDVEKVVDTVLKDDKKKWLRYEIGKILATTEGVKSVGIAAKYLAHKDTLTKSIGLDMFEKNRYPELTATIETMANDKKLGALQRRAKKMIPESNSESN